MKKVLFLSVLTMLFMKNVCADTIIIMDDNNAVKQQIYTLPHTAVQTVQTVTTAPTIVQAQPIYVTGAPLPPQQVVVTRPVQPVVVVRETSVPRNYYYDSSATAALAGFTGALIGGVVSSRGGRHHHHHQRY